MSNMSDMDTGALMVKAIGSGDPTQSEIAITNFKQYIKRNLVDLDDVLSYSMSLINAYKIRELSILSFSTLCHLIKRISIQDPSILQSIYTPVVSFLIDRLSENKESIRLTSIKTLRTCIETSPNGNIDSIIYYLINDGLLNENSDYNKKSKIQISVLDILYQIVESSLNFIFSFKPILSTTVKLLNSSDENIIFKSKQLILLYFNNINPNNNTAKIDLMNDLLVNNIQLEISTDLLKSIDINLYKKYIQSITSNQSNEEINPSYINNKLNNLLNQIPNWKLDELNSISYKDMDIVDDRTYDNLLSEFRIPFDGKETEKNWKNRQSLIVKLRQILRGKDFLSNLNNFTNFLKSIKESIFKGMVSLRTTLSNNSCQLCKEIAIFIGSYIDFNFIEYLLINLLKLTSARKIIQHQHANVAIIAILLNTQLNPKIFSILDITSQDKNIQPRVYTGNWIQLILLKYYDSDDLETFHYLVLSIENILIRGISDPIPQVKEAMRNAFWTLCEIDSSYESKIIKKLDYSIVKGLERARGLHINNNNSNIIKRTPIRELIKERVEEKQKEFELREREINREKENYQNQLYYESNKRTSKRSESLDESKLSERKNQQHQQHQQHQQQQQRAIRNHTIDTEVITKHSNTTNDELDDFTGRIRRENVIYEELTSDSKNVQIEGFRKFLFENNASSTIKFHNALNNLSIINPELFEIIFIGGNEKFFNKVSSYISTENILRLFCFYLIKSNDFDRIDFIVDKLSLEDLCLSIINILGYSIDASKIENINLSIQYIKNKFKIVNSILKIFERLIQLKKDIIKSYLLTSIFECLCLGFDIIDDKLIREEYIQIFKVCLTQYNDLFIRSIKEIKDENIKKDIIRILNLPDEDDKLECNLDSEIANLSKDIEMVDDQISFSIDEDENKTQSKFLSPIKVSTEEFDENIDHMTKVIPRLRPHNDENNLLKNNVISDMTMIFPKARDNSIFDFDKIELKYEEAEREISTGIEDMIEEIEKEEQHYSTHDQIHSDDGNTQDRIVEEDKDEANVEITDNNLEKTGADLEVNVGLEDGILTVEIDDDIVDDLMNDKEKIHSDSTPDMDQLTIEEKKTDGLINIDGYLGLFIKEMLQRVEKVEAIRISPNETTDIKECDDFCLILKSLEYSDHDKVYKSILSFLNGKYRFESFAVLRKLQDMGYESNDELNLITIFNQIVGSEADATFICIYEIIDIMKIKILVSVEKMHSLKFRLQEIILGCILRKIKERLIDGEDIFMIERLISRGVDSDDSFIRMNSFMIYGEMSRLYDERICDKNGIELVDNIVMNSMNDKVKEFCKNYI